MDSGLIARDQHVRDDVLLEVSDLVGTELAVVQLRLEDHQALLHLDARHRLTVVQESLEVRGGLVGMG
eukprot:scaffold20778_cov69-Phaeocystis_antarctica.AAC.9